MPAPCWSRRPAPARRHVRRSRLLDEPGPPANAIAARAAPPRRPRRCGAHGGDARRDGRRDDRTAGAAAEPRIGAHAHRGRHRRRVHPHDPRRSRARGRRGGAVRRVSRALARRRPRACAGARRAGRLARGPAASRHVGDARRRAGARASRRRAADRKRGPRLSSSDSLCRPRTRARGSRTKSRALC